MHNEQNRHLSEHQEMYLKAIFTLAQDHKVARGKEIAEKLGVTKSSVSGALKSLSDKGLIQYDPYSYVNLTPKGALLAKELTNKYDVLTDFLEEVLSVPRQIAEENACRMEHAIDNFVMERLVQFLKTVHKGRIPGSASRPLKKTTAMKH